MSNYNINPNAQTPTGTTSTTKKVNESPQLKKIEERLANDDVDLTDPEQVKSVIEDELKKEGIKMSNDAQKWALDKLTEMFKGSSKNKPKVPAPPSKETAPPPPSIPPYPTTSSPSPQKGRG